MQTEQNVEKIFETLTDCLAELDQLGAQVAAAHIVSALHALHRQFPLPPLPSVTE